MSETTTASGTEAELEQKIPNFFEKMAERRGAPLYTRLLDRVTEARGSSPTEVERQVFAILEARHMELGLPADEALLCENAWMQHLTRHTHELPVERANLLAAHLVCSYMEEEQRPQEMIEMAAARFGLDLEEIAQGSPHDIDATLETTAEDLIESLELSEYDLQYLFYCAHLYFWHHELAASEVTGLERVEGWLEVDVLENTTPFLEGAVHADYVFVGALNFPEQSEEEPYQHEKLWFEKESIEALATTRLAAFTLRTIFEFGLIPRLIVVPDERSQEYLESTLGQALGIQVMSRQLLERMSGAEQEGGPAAGERRRVANPKQAKKKKKDQKAARKKQRKKKK